MFVRRLLLRNTEFDVAQMNKQRNENIESEKEGHSSVMSQIVEELDEATVCSRNGRIVLLTGPILLDDCQACASRDMTSQPVSSVWREAGSFVTDNNDMGALYYLEASSEYRRSDIVRFKYSLYTPRKKEEKV